MRLNIIPSALNVPKLAGSRATSCFSTNATPSTWDRLKGILQLPNRTVRDTWLLLTRCIPRAWTRSLTRRIETPLDVGLLNDRGYCLLGSFPRLENARVEAAVSRSGHLRYGFVSAAYPRAAEGNSFPRARGWINNCVLELSLTPNRV